MRKLRAIAWGGTAVAVVALGIVATSARATKVAVGVVGPFATPSAHDVGELCADVGDGRACWGTGLAGPACDREVCAVARPLPAGAAPSEGWRCDGTRKAHVCEERGRNAGPWECDGGACLQREPRQPDDGEWSCVDMDGVVYCHGGGTAAGVVASRADLGWLCGTRRGGAPGERVCVDFAPDRPPAPDPTKCKFEYSGPDTGRVCVARDVLRVGDPCSAQRPCPTGASCVGGRCLPPRPAPECWFDTDCGAGGRCRWATCAAEGS